jgi:hypothetical protein
VQAGLQVPELLLGHRTLHFLSHNFLQLEFSVDMLPALLRFCSLKHNRGATTMELRQALQSGDRETIQAACSAAAPHILDQMLPSKQTLYVPGPSVP